MAQTHRQDLILAKVIEKNFVTIDELVDYFKVTPQTIRRDLNHLAEGKKLRRHHGGAGVQSSIENTNYQTRKVTNSDAKQKKAQAMVSIIPDGSSLFINIGTSYK